MSTSPSLTAFDWRQRVSADRYATVLAHVIHFGPAFLDAVLRRFGLEAGEWRAIDEAWSPELVEVTRRQQGLLAMRFTSTFVRARRQLAVKQPGISMIGEPILRPVPVDEPSTPEAPRERLMPTYQLREQAMSATPPPAPPPIVSPGYAEIEVPRGAPPAQLTETATVDLQSIIRGLKLPFGKDAAPDAPRPAQQPPERSAPRPRSSSGTQALTAMPDEADVLPFPPRPAADAPDDPTHRIPLAVYAEIAVSLGRGDDKAALCARHDLTEASWSAVASAWAQRIQADPHLQSQFHAHVKELKGER